MLIIIEITLAIALIMPAVPNVQPQACGGGFADVIVTDAKGKLIPDVTIEIVTAMAYDDFQELRNSDDFKQIRTEDVEAVIKRGKPLGYPTDRAGNPLKQNSETTKVKRYPPYLKNEDGATVLGFFRPETPLRPLLMKVSAPGYVTVYYAGSFLDGCRGVFNFVLHKDEKTDHQTEVLVTTLKSLPPGAQSPPLAFLVVATFESEGRWHTRLYDRRNPPADLTKIYELAGSALPID